jgi:hypothetical protein
MGNRNEEIKNIAMNELNINMETNIFFGGVCGFCVLAYVLHLFIPYV